MMKILISNPDGIGDSVLRLPLFAALKSAGHELLIIARQHAIPVLERLGAGIVIERLQENPYELTRAGGVDFSANLFEAVGRFDPELLVFAPYQWTIFEEWLAQLLPRVDIVRLSGYRFEHETNAGLPIPQESRVRVVEVDEYSHESYKNQALAEAILGTGVTLGDPTIQVNNDDIARGRNCLTHYFAPAPVPENFWFGCMGSTGDYYGDLKDWGSNNWIALLEHLVMDKRQDAVLVGSHAERASLDRLRNETRVAEHLRVVTGDLGVRDELSQLLGIAAISCGYVGRDTGPMHLAAALKKPVVAVFGGGMWPRFTPMVTPSSVMAVDLPCSPCRWICRHPESWCVKRVPREAVVKAVDAVISGEAWQREARLIAPSRELYEAARR